MTSTKNNIQNKTKQKLNEYYDIIIQKKSKKKKTFLIVLFIYFLFAFLLILCLSLYRSALSLEIFLAKKDKSMNKKNQKSLNHFISVSISPLSISISL